MNKYHFIIDKIKKNKELKKSFLNKYKNYPPQLSNVFIVIGGDGFMLHTLKKYNKYNKPFYGINTGTYGFLMNKFSSYDVDKIISMAKPITILPLAMTAKTKANRPTFAPAPRLGPARSGSSSTTRKALSTFT